MVGGITAVTIVEMLTEVEQCILYPGTTSSSPDKTAITSPQILELVACVLNHLQRVAVKPTELWQFWLKTEIPFTPYSGNSQICLWDYTR